MALEIERCLNVGVAYQGTRGHWEALHFQTGTVTTPGRQLGVPIHPVDDVHQAPSNEGAGDCG